MGNTLVRDVVVTEEVHRNMSRPVSYIPAMPERNVSWADNLLDTLFLGNNDSQP